ncbi:S-adenosyl-L-methionine-dependent methyltransferase [Thelephora terrestris]|uniref:S-adenosyl-L-methionine-dependent methyltransferase n=1 Tax=Thelephora terrestris TaxID=56493 RepID=A0A9P6HJ30_9AGAM|nr:S-adenosyl-L-methionine-dependent methyltransferase [Thelephora terrestris]
MATFAKATFDSTRYALFRPTYPRQLFDAAFRYHDRTRGARWDLAVDLGCGTGQATVELTPFKRVIGIDPSEKMVEQARLAVPQNSANRIEFAQGSAEDLSMLPDSSVDLVIAAQSSHWFNWDKVWPEIARVLKPSGTASIWGYGEIIIPKYPYLEPLISDYHGGPDQLGPHWEQPGRSIVEGLLRDVPAATEVCPSAFSEFQQTFFSSPHITDVPSPLPTILKKTMTWSDLLAYLRTSSALRNFHDKHPEDLARSDGNISERLLLRLIRNVEEREGCEITPEKVQVQVEWPLGLLQARKKTYQQL